MPNLLTTTLHFPDEGVGCTTDLEALGGDRYRVASIPMCESVGFGDIVQLRVREDAAYEVVTVIEKAGFRLYDWVLHLEHQKSERLRAILRRVDALGGSSLQVFGGILMIALPPSVDWDPTNDIADAGSEGKAEP